ncbi:MAG: PDZ domain-containing protein [Planctomycetaceae bacterium]|nr:MAG: PDZ domain-containing protein [Planctomycetaceae bacterium]
MTKFSDFFRFGSTLLLLVFSFQTLAADDQTVSITVDLQQIFDGQPPQTIADLQAMQVHQQELADRLVRSTVAVVVGSAHGSGVIISEDGYILTAAHVAGQPNRRATVIMSDGRRVRGTTLGCHLTLDAGLMKITDAGPWPYAEMAEDDSLRRGQWCLVTGHPGGYKQGRPPVVRVGRVLSTDRFAVTTDCTLVGGDSGGPLFDMEGKVIGINSRIGRDLTANLHVPVVAYRENWERLANGDQWGHFPGTGPVIGVRGAQDTGQAKIVQVYPGTAAEKAGIKAGDVIVKFGGKTVTDFSSLQLLVNDCQPGDKVKVELLREDRRVLLEIVVGRQGSP